jgi:ribosomal protein S18 acetylase RimI-like enzyme
VKIRTATTDDLAAVAEIHIAARTAYWRGTVPEADLDATAERLRREGYTPEKLNRPEFTMLVAQEHDLVVGFAVVGPPHDPTADGRTTGELWQIHVGPSHWRRGIGRVLHEACVHAWRSAGITEGHVEVWEGNGRGRAFYANRGWQLDAPTRPAPGGTTFLRLRLPLPARR